MWKYSWRINRARKTWSLERWSFRSIIHFESFSSTLLIPMSHTYHGESSVISRWFDAEESWRRKSWVSWLSFQGHVRRGATFVLAVRNFEDQDRETFMKFPVPISNFDKFTHTRHAAKLRRKRFANF